MGKQTNTPVLDWTKDWTAEVVGRMHTSRITGQALANECGYTNAYLSTVLNGKSKSEIKYAKEKIFTALEKLEDAFRSSVSGSNE